MCDQNAVNLQEGRETDYKSCFARSVAVSSQYDNTKTVDRDEVNYEQCREDVGTFSRYRPEYTTLLRIKKNPRRTCLEDGRRYSCGAMSTMRQNPLYAQRISEIPIENMMHQNKVETLEWQLKEVENSREMYRAVMKQVVTFLEKAHQSLESLSKSPKNGTVPRSKSEHHITSNTSNNGEKEIGGINEKPFSWNVTKREQYISEKNIPPDKLSQEAFRLLRMTQSLLETREPKLSQGVSECLDTEFLSLLAKEFPASPEHWPKRSTSFTHISKITHNLENDIQISTAFNRKLSLQMSGATSKNSNSSCREQQPEGGSKEDNFQLTPDLSNLELRENSTQKTRSSISSGEDESGFSSLTSFQEIGLPLVNSTTAEEVSTRNALLKSMLHNSADTNRLGSPKTEFFRTTTPISNGGSPKSESFRTPTPKTEIFTPSSNGESSKSESFRTPTSRNEMFTPTPNSHVESSKSESFRTPTSRTPAHRSAESGNDETLNVNNPWRTSSSAGQHKRSLSTPIQKISPKPSAKVLWV